MRNSLMVAHCHECYSTKFEMKGDDDYDPAVYTCSRCGLFQRFNSNGSVTVLGHIISESDIQGIKDLASEFIVEIPVDFDNEWLAYHVGWYMMKVIRQERLRKLQQNRQTFKELDETLSDILNLLKGDCNV